MDELLSDYIERLADKNGFSGVKAFKRYLKKYYRLHPKIGVYENPKGESDRWLLEGLLRKHVSPDTIKPVRVYEGGIWLREHRKCPDCYREAPYLRFNWRLKAYRFCHLHYQKLAETNDEEASIHEGVVLKALKYYEGTEQVQRLVLFEMSCLDYELEILSALEIMLFDISEIREKLEILRAETVAGALVGLSVEARVDYMSELLRSDAPSKDAITRLIILVLICNETTLYISYKGDSHKESCAKYKKYAAIFMGLDRVLQSVFEQDNLDSVNNIAQIRVSEIYKPIADNKKLAAGVRHLIYLGRIIKSWEKITLGWPPVNKLSAVIN
ncbi:TniQ family protein [Gilvimarinus algae]|uniref:TniQ family protein n=1 Tax=Gilvimarinus algae TaxID=3058037 RepID=A0ABT8T9T1_9GAMM|nr:TniQ family protein [Gilvimarinus sp. SDUM040014]MDO3380887.1 TniQ family protein [Gilvimarinus sp. SDUM040014]